MRTKRKNGLVVATVGSALIAGATALAFAAPSAPRTPPPPSGSMNLRISGSAVITPTSGSATPTAIDGIGQVIADTSGAFTGALTYTAVSPALASEDVCAGTVAGTITAPSGAFASGSGEFTIGLNYTPLSSSIGADCIPSTATLLCNRTLGHLDDINDLDAGQYHCIATSVTAAAGAAATVTAASLNGELNISRGSNAPTS